MQTTMIKSDIKNAKPKSKLGLLKASAYLYLNFTQKSL
jgi:hypothetical protein